ncbi:EAL domain-containing protein [Glaciecola sp. 1036]|uniref:EAL domain-containing protein n=1 Tax=Alteromonadaceae TaxID=72275 RepID=UPI003D0676D9
MRSSINLIFFCFVFACFRPSLALENTSPLIIDPRLHVVDTSIGLNQDSVYDMHVDDIGFLWLGTDEGLNRYDGQKVDIIRDIDGLLRNNPIYFILQPDPSTLILSTGKRGIVVFDLNKNTARSILDVPLRLEVDFKQFSDAMLIQENGNILVAMNEEIYRLDAKTFEATMVFRLTDTQVENMHSIRALYYENGLLLIGTTNGLLAYDEILDSSKVIFESLAINDHSADVKFLNRIEPDYLWIGTVKGLYKYNYGSLIKHIKSNWQLPPKLVVNSDLNIWDVKKNAAGQIYIGSEIGLLNYNQTKQELVFLLEPKKNVEVISNPAIKRLVFDANDNVWLATDKSGAFLWSPVSLLFKNVFKSAIHSSENNLSNNSVWSLNQTTENTLWVGTVNGLNKYDLDSGKIQIFNQSPSRFTDFSESDIQLIETFDQRYLWLSTGTGVRLFDTQETVFVDIAEKYSQEIKQTLDGFPHAIRFDGVGNLWSVNPESDLFYIDLKNKKVINFSTIAPEFPTPEVADMVGYDAITNMMLVASYGKLIGINIDDLSWKVLHQIHSNLVDFYSLPNAFVRDGTERIWLSYLGVGLFELDSQSFKERNHYNDSNILADNILYGLHVDHDGNLWFSSHSGIHRLSPTSSSVNSFHYAHGLSSVEFNQGAYTVLSSGDIAYGGNSGFTIFSPDKLSEEADRTPHQPIITSVSLASRELISPLTDLTGTTINLNYDDFGLSISFSIPSFNTTYTPRFGYRIINDKNVINYPVVANNKITIPTLPAGKYKIEVYNANKSRNQSEPAVLFVNVSYHPMLTPIAIVLYVLTFLSLLAFYLHRKSAMELALTQANKQVSLYNKRLNDALEATNSHIWEWSSESNLLVGERIKQEFTGTENASIVFEDYIARIYKDDVEDYINHWNAFLDKKIDHFDITYRFVDREGEILWYRDIGSLIDSENNNKALSIKGTYSNLTQSVAAQERLKLFGNAFKSTRDWVIIFDRNYSPVVANPTMIKAFGISGRKKNDLALNQIINNYHNEYRLLIKRMKELQLGEHWKDEVRLNVNQRQLTFLVDISAISMHKNSQSPDYFLVIGTDITQQIQAQSELQKLANYDVLTGLINRSLLIERMRHSIQFARRHQTKVYALFIDLDGFKPVNDSFGHQAGDKLLIEIANRIKNTFREQDSVARLGGDEFVVVLDEVADNQQISRIMQELCDLISQPISLGNTTVSVSACIGAAMYPEDADNAENLLRNADIAMYDAKAVNNRQHSFFNHAMNEQVHWDVVMRNKIRVATNQKEFINHYQPIIDASTGYTAGFELLLRWRDGETEVSPAQFIPIAEKTGCIVDITMDAIEATINDMANWYLSGFRGYVAINLSPLIFNGRPQLETICGMLRKHNLPVSSLRFEITESVLIDEPRKVTRYMQEIQNKGFLIALDDFGTGYSSLKYLKDFPIDILKIDKSFVDDIDSDRSTQSIVSSTLQMSRAMDIQTIAEGVETQEQLAYFARSGCGFLQGFIFSKAVDAAEAKLLINKQWFDVQESNVHRLEL